MTPWPQVLWLDTPRGQGRVIACVDRGPDSDLEWVCVTEDGSIWSFMNQEVRVAKNITYGVRDGKEDNR